MTKDTSRGFELTSIKAQYIVERLNEVLGITGWRMKGEFNSVDGGMLYIGKLEIKITDMIHEIEAIGYSGNKKNPGDTYKSARTDALSKAASYLGVGNSVFKGNVKVDDLEREQKDALKTKNKLLKSITDSGKPIDEIKALMAHMFDKTRSTELSLDELRELAERVSIATESESKTSNGDGALS
jgi:hypothetical protein